jgi:hypothetical protein
VRPVLGETWRLLGTHLHLFTLISLTVWFPAHVLRNYLEFFGPADRAPAQALQVLVTVQLVFDPLVVSASLAALVRIKHGLPVGYALAITDGLGAWARLMVVRFVVNCAVALPGLAGLAISAGATAASLAWAGMLTAVAVFCVVLLVRFAVVDSVVVLERRTVLTAWSRAAALTAGHRWSILWTLVVLFSIVMSFALAADQLARAVPELNHFVVRVLVDCAMAVAQSVFTIALFLWYWRARTGTVVPAAPPLASAA